MNTKDERALELKVGLFVAIGLAFIAVMVFKFGSVGQGFSKTYPILVDFPSADGLIKRSDVKLNGARIGYVTAKPQIARTVGSVAVPISIQEEVRLPKGSHFVVGSSGLMGDRFVDVIPDASFDAAKFNPDDATQTIAPNTTLKGEKSGGLEVLTKKGELLLDQLNGEIVELRDVTARVKDGVLSPASIANIQATFSNLETTTKHFAIVSQDLGGVLTSAQSAVESAKGAIDNANQTITTVGGTVGKIDPAIADLRKLIGQGQDFVKSARSGNGALNALLYDKATADDLRALISNMRTHGVLFYKDSAAKKAAAERAAAPSR